jgi:hypothetical protein
MKWNVVLSMLCMVQIASAQFDSPWITEGPVNAASYKPADWLGSGITQGSVFIVKRMVLGPTPIVTATSFPLQTELGGTSLEVTIGGTTVKPYLIYTSYSQVLPGFCLPTLPSEEAPSDCPMKERLPHRSPSRWCAAVSASSL